MPASPSEVRRAIVGHQDVLEGVMLCLLTGGHAILEGVPGIGKTLLVRTLAEVLDLDFRRIQFTPDLMPADIVGTNVIVETAGGGRDWEFRPGPIFGHLILADEINRATPKTQSALLEAMQERSVTVARTTHRLREPFFVLATQNPLEMEGTYPLPEAQLDRFALKLLMAMPSREEISEIVDRTTGPHAPQDRPRGRRAGAPCDARPGARGAGGRDRSAITPAPWCWRRTRSLPRRSPMVRKYVRYGASPRGAQSMILGGKVLALLAGRYNVAYDDVRKMARPALRHRLILNFEAEAARIDPDAIVEDVLKTVPEPSS